MKTLRNVCAWAIASVAAISNAIYAPAQDVITTVVGGGPTGIPALNANISTPQQLAIDAQGNYYFATYGQHVVFKVSTGGTITIVAGTGIGGYSGDNGLATKAQLNYPQGIAVDTANPANVYIADTNNCLVRKVTGATGVITTIAGLVNTPDGSAPYPSCGFLGDTGKANVAELYYPVALALNPANSDLYIADYQNGRIRKVAGGKATGTITTIAGGGGDTANANNCQGTAPFGDAAAANKSYLCYPTGVSLDTTASPVNVFVSETHNTCDIREVVGSSAKIYQVAGSYTLGCGFTDNVKATSGQLYYPYETAVQVSGATTTVSVADYYNNRIRRFTLTYSAGVPKPGNIVTIAGNGSGYSGDGGPALSAGISSPVGVAYDASGNYLVAGQGDSRIRKVLKSTGYINTAAGWGYNPYYSNPLGISGVAGGGVALYQPTDVFADPLSTKVYIGGNASQNDYVWDSSTTKVSNFAGSGVGGFGGDGTSAIGSGTLLDNPLGVVKDSSGNVFIADSAYCVVREVSASTGKISTVVGGSNGSYNGCGYGGDGGSATAAKIYSPQQLAIDSGNNLFIADYNNCLIRRVSKSTGNISTVAGLVTTVNGIKTAGNCAYSGDTASAVKAQLYYPLGVAVDGFGDIFVVDYYGSRIRKVDSTFGTINTVAGNGNTGYTGDGNALQSSLYNPRRLAADFNGNLFIADYNNSILRWVDPAGQLTTFAGSPPGSPQGSNGFSGDGGKATSALLSYPQGITQDGAGNFYFADSGNDRIRKVTAFAGYGRSTAEISFGETPTGGVSDDQYIYLSAIGPVTINSISVPAGFSEIDDCSGASLAAGDTCEIDVVFAPTKTGVTEGLLTISSNALFANQGNTVALSGHGTGLTLSGSLAFGTDPLKTAVSKTVTLSNGGASLTLTKTYLTQTTDFSITGGTCPLAGGTLASNASCTLIVTFKPQTTGGKKSTLVIGSKDPLSPLLAGATGTGTAVKLSSSTLAFPTTTFGTAQVLNLTITNLGTSTLTVKSAISGSGAAAFTVLSTGNTCSAGTAAGKSCVLPVQFKPATVGSFAGTLTLTTNGGSNPAIPLTGTDTAAVTATPTTINFTTITHGTSETSNVTIKNVGKNTLSLKTAFTGTGTAAYAISSTGNTCGTSVAAGVTCTLPVKFSPAAAQTYVATLTLTTNGGVNPTISLSGAGK